MSDLERAKLIPVSGNKDTPDMGNAIDVQFNPTSLKVTLSNTLKENSRNGNSRATQYVDKSSSSLTVELIFDTTYIEAPTGNNNPGGAAGSGATSSNKSGSNKPIEQGSDVRLQTKKIADAFVKPVASGKKMAAPKRCLFQWGAFEFLGLVDSFEETVDFFSPNGRPLRATVSLKLKEDRYQFRNRSTAAQNQNPKLSFTGNGADKKQPGGGSGAGNGNSAPNQNTSPVPGASKDGPGSWRDNAMFNGVESPRLPASQTLALPGVSLSEGAGFGISGGVGIGLNAGIGISGGFSASLSASVNVSAGVTVSASANVSTGGKDSKSKAGPAPAPAFRFGNSAALGTGVPGAFSPNPNASLKAAGLQAGSLQLRAEATTTSASGATIPAQPDNVRATASTPRSKHGVSVAALLKNAPDSGVGFD